MSDSISVVIAAYNAGDMIATAIESVAAQTHPHRELIIVDGGSRDGTGSVVARFPDTVTLFISEPDKGICEAWNKGVAAASGEWICFLGADDAFAGADVLARFAEVARAVDPKATKIVYGRVTMVDASGAPTRRLGAPWDAAGFREKGMIIPHQAVFHHASLFDEFGLFSPDAGLALDYELLLRHLRDADALFLPHFDVALMGDGGLSSDPARYATITRLYRDAQRLHGTRRWTVGSQLYHLRLEALSLAHRLSPEMLGRLLDRRRAHKLRKNPNLAP